METPDSVSSVWTGWMPLSLTFTFTFLVIEACGVQDQVLPMRRDCIVKVALQWPKETTAVSREQVLERIEYFSSIAAGTLGQDYLATLAIPANDRDHVYLQFKRNCSDRLRMTRTLVSYVHERVPEAPPLVVLPDIVEPGPETIEVWGPNWADKPDS